MTHQRQIVQNPEPNQTKQEPIMPAPTTKRSPMLRPSPNHKLFCTQTPADARKARSRRRIKAALLVLVPYILAWAVYIFATIPTAHAGQTETAESPTVSLNLYGVSHHYNKCWTCSCPKGADHYNAYNGGAALQYTTSTDNPKLHRTYLIGAYNDSYCELAAFAVTGIRYDVTDKFYIGADAGLMHGSGFKTVGAYPVMGYKITNNVAVEGMVAPVIAAWLHITFGG